MTSNCFFFHIGILVFLRCDSFSSYYTSFCRLSIAVRLLSDAFYTEESLEKLEALIKLFFSNFVELYGEDAQSFNFHTMRHLVEQVKRNGPLWLFSAFCFESANHSLLSAVSGTIKTPEKIVERFLKNQVSYDEFLSSERQQKMACLTSFTRVSEEIYNFCKEQNVELLFSRYQGVRKFCSLSYTRLNDNLGECIVMLKNGNFVLIECFAKKSGEYFAICRAFRNVVEIDLDILGNLLSGSYIFKLTDAGSLDMISVEKLLFKTIVITENKTHLVSVIREGFEHN